MSRLAIPDSIETAPAASQGFLQAVKKQLGVVPNLFRLVSNSAAALEGYLGLSGALGKGKLPAQTRERRRRNQWLRLLPVGAHLSRQEPGPSGRCRDDRQSQRRLQ